MNDDLIKKALHRIDVEKVKLQRNLVPCKPSFFEGSSSKELRRAYNYRLDKLFAMEDALENFQKIGNIDEDKDLFDLNITSDLRAVKTLDTRYYEMTGIDGVYAVQGFDDGTWGRFGNY
jgi:hypothetical protein